MKRRRWMRLSLLLMGIAALALYSGAYSKEVLPDEPPPGDPPPPPPPVTMTTANGAIVDYSTVEWGQSGQVDIEFQRDAAGVIQALIVRAPDGTVLSSTTRAEAEAMGLHSLGTPQQPTQMMSQTSAATTSGFTFNQPITSVYGAGVTVSGNVTWR